MKIVDLSNENVKHIKKNGIEFLQFVRLLEYSNEIKHAYSLGIDLNYRTSSLENVEYALKCYDRLCNAIDERYENVVKPNQNHTDVVKVVERKINEVSPDINLEEYINVDGLITSNKKLILSTTNADCILMLFFDPVKKVIANIHSGWKGTVKRISVRTVKKMCETYGCKAENIICCICPSIRKCHFEVTKDVKDIFCNEFTDIDGYIECFIPNEKWKIDTILINKKILLKEGLLEENILDSGICSVCNREYIHSYRNEGRNYGLSTALIELI